MFTAEFLKGQRLKGSQVRTNGGMFGKFSVEVRLLKKHWALRMIQNHPNNRFVKH